MRERKEAQVTSEEIRQGIAMIRVVARQMHRRIGFMDIEDLVSIGLATLHDAIGKFDPKRSNFGAYLRRRVVWAMLSASRKRRRPYDANRGLPVGLSRRYLHDRGRRVRVAPVQGEHALPSVLEFRSVLRPTVAAAGDLGKTAVCQRANPEESLMRSRLGGKLRAAVETLPQLERKVVAHHYFDGETFASIATRIGKSRPQVCRLHQRALRRMAHVLGSREVQEEVTR